MYSAKSVLVNFPFPITYVGLGLPNPVSVDAYSKKLKEAFAAADWDTELVGSYFDVVTNGNMPLSFVLASPVTFAAWGVSFAAPGSEFESGNTYLLIDDDDGRFTYGRVTLSPEQEESLDLAGLLGETQPQMITGITTGTAPAWAAAVGYQVLMTTTDKATLHRRVISAILLLHPAYRVLGGGGVATGVIPSTTYGASAATRLSTETSFNRFTDGNIASPSERNLVFGLNVSTSVALPPQFGGWMATSQPAVATGLPGGTENRLTLYWTIRKFGAVRGWVMGAAKKATWQERAHPSYVEVVSAIDGLPTSLDFSGWGGHQNFGNNKGSPITTYGFICPHQAIFHVFSAADGMIFFCHAGGGKLVDFRQDRSPGEVLPWDEVAWAVLADIATRGHNFRQGFSELTGKLYLAVNGSGWPARKVTSTAPASATGATGPSGGIGSPRIGIYAPANFSNADGLGVVWQSGHAELFEPWFGFNPYMAGGVTNNLNQQAPALGQLWDCIGFARATPAPDGFSFDWDPDEPWQPYTVNGNPSTLGPFTLCFRRTEVFTG